MQVTVLLATEQCVPATVPEQPLRLHEKICGVALTYVTPVGKGSVITTFDAVPAPTLEATMS